MNTHVHSFVARSVSGLRPTILGISSGTTSTTIDESGSRSAIVAAS